MILNSLHYSNINSNHLITPTITIGSWNLNGYILNNYVLRDEIINYIDCDVYFISETHLKEGEKINVQDYTWDCQSSKMNVKKHQKRVMGWVGFCI